MLSCLVKGGMNGTFYETSWFFIFDMTRIMNGTENQYKGCGNKIVYLQALAFLWKYTDLLSHSWGQWQHDPLKCSSSPIFVSFLIDNLVSMRVSLWRHIKYCHINTAPVLCRHCNQGQSALNLKRHEKACKLKVMNNNGDSYMNSNMIKKYPKLSMKHIVRVKKLNPKFLKSLN